MVELASLRWLNGTVTRIPFAFLVRVGYVYGSSSHASLSVGEAQRLKAGRQRRLLRFSTMNFYSDDTYGERVAGIYDEWYSEYEPSAIDMLAELAGGGKVLELGIGTGRIALPLSARGIEVHGIDAATSMISRLRSKPGS